mgnify:CR=1 FL=1
MKTKKKLIKAMPLADQQIIDSRRGKNIIVVDTNVLVQDPDCIRGLLKGGNLIVIPWKVFIELDGLKRSKEVGWEAGKAIKNIHALVLAKANIIIERRTVFPNGDLDKNEPDHRIVATAVFIVKSLSSSNSPYFGYEKVKLVTNDDGMQIVASQFIVNPRFSFEPYKRDLTRIKEDELKLPVKTINQAEIKKNAAKNEYCSILKSDRIPYGVPTLINLNNDDSGHSYAVSLRRGDNLEFLDNNIRLAGVGAKNNGEHNWQQIAALHLLADDAVSAVFLQGGAGTGKTLLALAAGIHQKEKKKFKQLIVIRPTLYLSDDDNLGFLPGDLNQKLAPWLLSIKHNLSVINKPKKSTKAKGEELDLDVLAKAGIEIQPLGYIRGASFENCYIIIEEAQNLPRHLIKTILTRPAEGTKIVFTGDLGQIDNTRLTKESSGLTYAISKMKGNPIVGIVNFEQTLRSELASLADKIL